MKNPKYKYKFGLLVEAYCRGLGGNLRLLLKQIDAIEKLSSLTYSIKNDYSNLGLIKVNK
jgi:phosphatidylinositol-4,5-bisphosphate 3-kinase